MSRDVSSRKGGVLSADVTFSEWWDSLPEDWAGLILAQSRAATVGEAYRDLAEAVWEASRQHGRPGMA